MRKPPGKLTFRKMRVAARRNCVKRYSSRVIEENPFEKEFSSNSFPKTFGIKVFESGFGRNKLP